MTKGDSVKTDEKQDNLPVIEQKRELTEPEQQRIQRMHEQRKGKFSKDLFQASEDKKISYFRKLDLQESESWDECDARLCQATGFVYAGYELLKPLAISLCKGGSVEEIISKLNDVTRLLQEFQPRDPIEGMICGQIIVLQRKWLDLLEKAECQKSSSQWANTYFNAANKLLGRSQTAIQLLISHRRGGKQKVTVEHIHVAPGAQAAIGLFSTGGGGGGSTGNLRGTP